MDIKIISGKIINFLKKYRYAVLVLVIGLILITMPTGKEKDNAGEVIKQTVPTKQITTEEQLSALLSKIQGAGTVEVMLTVAEGEEIVYQEKADTSNNTDLYSSKKDTVTVTDSQKNQAGLVRQVIPPKYLGAIVICQGADNPTVKLAIVDAVSKITGLGADCISVLKMK